MFEKMAMAVKLTSGCGSVPAMSTMISAAHHSSAAKGLKEIRKAIEHHAVLREEGAETHGKTMKNHSF